MKNNLPILATGFILGGLVSNAQAVQLLIEDFEDSTVDYTLTQGLNGAGGPATETGDGSGDYFGRIGGSGGLTTSETYNGVDGNGFFAIQDMDASNTGDPNISSNIAYMTWSGIDITTHTSFSFSILLAENRPGGTLGWDADMSFKVEYQIDSGGYQDLLAVASSNTAFNNQPAAIDTNFDGEGEGAIIDDTFSGHSATFTGAGTSLDLRFTMLNFTGASEDIGFDNVSLEAVPVPEPSSATLAAMGLFALLGRRKRS